MAFAVDDRVKETSTTTGTGTLTLAGAETGFQAFSEIGNANTTTYVIEHTTADEWEVGRGTYTAAGTLLSRDTVISSSNADSLVNFSAGTKNVFVDLPSSLAFYRDCVFPLTGLLERSTTAGITASTTQTQGQGALTADVNEVSVVDNTNDTVTLPTAAAGRVVKVINDGANTLQIFPASGDDLGGGVNTATTLATGFTYTFVAFDADTWEREMTGASGSMAIGGAISGATQGSVLFAGAAGVLAQDNIGLNYSSATGLKIGSVSEFWQFLHESSEQVIRTTVDGGGVTGRVLLRQASTNDIFFGDIDANGGKFFLRTNGTTKFTVDEIGDCTLTNGTNSILFGFPSASGFEPVIRTNISPSGNGRIFQRQLPTNDVFVGDIDASGGKVFIRANGVTWVTLDELGLVGVNVTATARIHVSEATATRPAARFQSSDGSTTNPVAQSLTVSSTTNTVLTNLYDFRRESSGTPANGIGAGFQFTVETSVGNFEVGATIAAICSDVTATSEDFGLALSTMVAGSTTLVEGMRVVGSNVGIGTTEPSRTVHAVDTTAFTNGVDAVLRVEHRTSATPADGIGGSIEFVQQTTAGSPGNLEIIATVVAKATSVSAGAEYGSIGLFTQAAGSTTLVEGFRVQSAAAGVNRLEVTAGATGTAPILSAAGTDTNISITITPKGTGQVGIGGTPTETLQIHDSSPALGFVNTASSNYEWTLDATGNNLQISDTAGAGRVMLFEGTTGFVGVNTSFPASLLDVRGDPGTGAAAAGVLSLTTSETTVVILDQLGRIDFAAPQELSGTDAILTAASIWAEAAETFTSTVNRSDLVFATAITGAASQHMRLNSQGRLGLITAGTVDAKLHVIQDNNAAAIPALLLDQRDIDDSFINFIGTSAADGTRSISSDTTEDSAKFGAIQVEINGVTKWIRVYDDES